MSELRAMNRRISDSDCYEELTQEELTQEDALIRPRKIPLKGIMRQHTPFKCQSTAPESTPESPNELESSNEYDSLGYPGASSTDAIPQVFYDECDEFDELKPKKLDLHEPRKVRFVLPETFREASCDRDHPDHKSLRAVVVAKQIEKRQDLYQGRRKRMAEALSGFSLAALCTENVHWLLLQHASDVAQAHEQLATRGYQATKMHLHKVQAKATAVAAAAARVHHVGQPPWFGFLQSGLSFCPVKSVRHSVEGSAREALPSKGSTSQKSLHAISARAHHEAKTVHATHLAALKAKAAASSAAAAVHFSLCPLGTVLVGSCLLYARTTSRSRSQ
jgi:hypothetical protein